MHGGAFFQGLVESAADAGGEPTGWKPIYYVYAAVIYFVSVFLATFFNVAFYSEILNALNGQRVSLTVLVGFFYLLNVASQVYLCALYLYASGGTVPAPYDQELMNAAWKVKK